MKRKALIIALMFCISLAFAGCSYNWASGDASALAGKSEEDIEAHIIRGKTTKEEVLAYLGKPSSKFRTGDLEQWSYHFNQGGIRTGFMGIGSKQAHSGKYVSVQFNNNGVVENITTNFNDYNNMTR